MTILRLMAETQQMVSVGARGSSAVAAGLSYVPGTTLRGALAGRWLEEHDQHKQRLEFEALFERGRFGPLLPIGGQLVPRSYKEHKYAAGEECLPTTAPGHEGYDEKRCPRCGQQLVAVKDCLKLPDRDVSGRSLRTSRARVQLDQGETAMEGLLFERTGIAPAVRLIGYADVPETAQGWLGTELVVRVGGAKTVAGSMEVAFSEVDSWGGLDTGPDGHTVTLVLGAPGVFVDDAGRPRDRPSEEQIAAVTGIGCTVLDNLHIRWTRVGGWHWASGLPKPSEWAVDAGSTFQVRFVEQPPARALTELMRRGVGLRRNEGFGWLMPPSVATLTGGTLNRLARIKNPATAEALANLVADDLTRASSGDNPTHLARRIPTSNVPPEIAALRTITHARDLAAAFAALRRAVEAGVRR